MDKEELIEYFKTKRVSIMESIKTGYEGLKQEGEESKRMFKLSKKILDGKLTPAEKEFLKEQSGDILRLIVSGVVVVAVPGGSAVIPILVKAGVPIVPSSFKNKENYSDLKI